MDARNAPTSAPSPSRRRTGSPAPAHARTPGLVPRSPRRDEPARRQSGAYMPRVHAIARSPIGTDGRELLDPAARGCAWACAFAGGGRQRQCRGPRCAAASSAQTVSWSRLDLACAASFELEPRVVMIDGHRRASSSCREHCKARRQRFGI